MLAGQNVNLQIVKEFGTMTARWTGECVVGCGAGRRRRRRWRRRAERDRIERRRANADRARARHTLHQMRRVALAQDALAAYFAQLGLFSACRLVRWQFGSLKSVVSVERTQRTRRKDAYPAA